jgi:hypothetical protein
MDGYDPAKPFRLYSTPSPGVSEGNRGGLIRCASYTTLDEAQRASHNLESGYSFSLITHGPGTGTVVWPA